MNATDDGGIVLHHMRACVIWAVSSILLSGSVADAFGLGGVKRLFGKSKPAATINFLDDEAAFERCVQDATEQDRLAVVKIYADWCKACKAAAPKYQQVATDYPDVEFNELLWEDNKGFCRSRQISKLPVMIIVAGGRGEVESFVCGPKKFDEGMLQKKLDTYAADSP